MAEYFRTPTGRIQTLTALNEEWKLILQASGTRKQATGVHATISVAVQRGKAPPTVLDEDLFNVERREDRNRLGNAAAKNPIIAKTGVDALLGKVIQAELMHFCRGLWEYELGEIQIDRRGGASERVAPSLLLDPYIIDGGGTILFAPPGRGKSYTALIWATLIDAGLGFYDKDERPLIAANRDGAPVLFVNLERGLESVDQRVGNVNQALALPRGRGIFRLDRRGWSLADVLEAVDRSVRREGIRLVVLDSLTRGGFGDMRDNLPANKAMDGLNSLGTAWLALAHTARGDEGHVFGSVMFDAAADIMCQMLTEPRGDLLGVGVRGMKANDIKLPPLHILALHFDEIGLDSVRIAEPGEFLLIETEGAQLDTSDALMRYVLEVGKTSATDAAAALDMDRSIVSRLFSKSGNYAFVGKEGRSAMYSVKAKRDDDEAPPPDDSHYWEN